MKPKDVIEMIREGNENFLTSKEEVYFTSHMEKQSPLITMLSCSDSRVQTSAILPDAVNQIFTIENIGNQVSNTEGSIDYGIYHLKTPVLLIVGHADCGAIKAYSSGYDEEPATIQRELNNLQAAYINEVKDTSILVKTHKNINYQVQVAMSKYAKLVNDEKLAVVGAYYDFANLMDGGFGKLHILNVNGIFQEEVG